MSSQKSDVLSTHSKYYDNKRSWDRLTKAFQSDGLTRRV